jgi:hypothetical protein
MASHLQRPRWQCALSKLLFERVHGQRDWSSGPMASGGTKIEVRHFNAIEDEISGS